MITSREIRFRTRPLGEATIDNFELVSVPVPEPSYGEVQVRNHFMSVDPYMRGRMSDQPSYITPFQLGKTLEGAAVGEVIASADLGFVSGDIVLSMYGWREAFTAKPAEAAMQKLEPRGLPPQSFLGVMGMPGMTAYLGLFKIACMQPGETVFVTAAAGAVGHVVCQLAKIRGGRVIGSAGGAQKCARLREMGVDYKASSNLTRDLADIAPNGIHICFDNVGGSHLEAALAAARSFARIVLCGAIAMYRDPGQPSGLNLSLVIRKNLRMEGFQTPQRADLAPHFDDEMAKWIWAGELKGYETVDEGIENAPSAFLKLFTGGNFGKMLVKLA